VEKTMHAPEMENAIMKKLNVLVMKIEKVLIAQWVDKYLI